jgi:succinate dehydrogenase/fumarate reductase-like Fe-S protein
VSLTKIPAILCNVGAGDFRKFAGSQEADGALDPVGAGLRPDTTVLDALDRLNKRLAASAEPPVAFESDCREGVWGACGLVVNGRPHGPRRFWPQGQPGRSRRAHALVAAADRERFGGCTLYGECTAACPKRIDLGVVAPMNREYLRAALARWWRG